MMHDMVHYRTRLLELGTVKNSLNYVGNFERTCISSDSCDTKIPIFLAEKQQKLRRLREKFNCVENGSSPVEGPKQRFIYQNVSGIS